jgi:hypothetical protein
MNAFSKPVAADVINAMLTSEQMPFLNKREFCKQMNTQTMAMTTIREKSKIQFNEMKNMISAIKSSLCDGPTITSPPKQIRQNWETMLADTTATNSNPPSTETAGAKS